jgi:hypothetical protein
MNAQRVPTCRPQLPSMSVPEYPFSISYLSHSILGNLCCWKYLSKPHTLVCWLAFLLAWRLAILTEICDDFLEYSEQILPWRGSLLLPWLHLPSPWYRILEHLDIYFAHQDVACCCTVQRFITHVWKKMLSDPFMAMTVFFFQIHLISLFIIILQHNFI